LKILLSDDEEIGLKLAADLEEAALMDIVETRNAAIYVGWGFNTSVGTEAPAHVRFLFIVGSLI
jgi:hypothetical protein